MRTAQGRRRLATAALMGLLLSTAPALASKDSGFLSDYSKLKQEKDALGVERRIWTSEKLIATNYRKVLLLPVAFYPEPEPTKDVSAEVLKEILAYMDATVKKNYSAEMEVVEQPGPGVMRLRIGITAVDVEKGLKARELIPVSLLRAGVKEATGRRKHDVKLMVECELTDSVSMEPLARVVRDAEKIVIKSKETLSLEDAKPTIDQWGEAIRQEIVKRLK